ncbi:hypothetical protein [Clostridium tyrobutyricum]|uniref:hypothetical protein n=1 Tax=Clostridium tyrobutyricum TaxID=1519 RepID=UPI0002DB8A86|nr:hypothetical protein [Clostridium tyrobutyricum]MBR9648634.1 hypothetical protein [Clostridium tyrobutyricum]MBV4426438.1 hypothetical protein [Clostridium tyrobutyricum]MBV4427462.1 hypothetical protein [Clostridium tyrobutyricum]MBV4440407.1 hypothetical protein [Clostridium tyrobutyricum]MBV4443764.1 hypothetical protein [Clostridium tyrobutyricum]
MEDFILFSNKEALYREIIDDEKNRIRLKISSWVEKYRINPKEYFIEISHILSKKIKENKLYESQQEVPYNLMSELIFDIGKDNKKEKL